VRPYVKAQKNDDRDAEAIAEAATRPTMRFVELKSEEQLDMQTLHRVRDRLVGERTALINQLRAILLERGVTVAQGRRKLEQHLATMLDDDNEAALSPRMRQLIDEMRVEWVELDRRIVALDNEFAAHARTDADARRLATIPGIGVLNATALVAAVGNAQTFARGRDLAAWLGLVPRQITTGGKPRLVGITKRGNKYLRKLLVHGARSVMPALAASATPLGGWLRGCWRACTRTPPWSPWPTSWRASCGLCCGEVRRSTPRQARLRDRDRPAAAGGAARPLMSAGGESEMA
jgi:transposase